MVKRPGICTKKLWDKMTLEQQKGYLELSQAFKSELMCHGGIKAPQRATITHNHAHLAVTTILPNKRQEKLEEGWKRARELSS